MKLINYLIEKKEYLPFWISLFIVIIVSAISVHPDFIVISKLSERIANGDLRIYHDLYIGDVYKGIPIMPPLISLLDGLFYFFLKELSLLDFNINFNDPISSFHLLVLKSRYIIAFAISYPLIYKVALSFTNKDKELSRKIANLWISSPIIIYIPFAQGNNDIYPVVCSLLFLLFAFQKSIIMAMIFLGLTAALKGYALFLILPAALILSHKNLKKTLLYCLISVSVYALPSLIYLKGLSIAVPGNIEKYLMLKTAIPSNAEPYSIFAIGYFIILLLLYFSDNLKQIVENTNKMLVLYGFLILSLFYITWYFPQWFLWILPFFIFLIYKRSKLYSIYILISSVYLFYTYFGYPNNLDLYLWRQLLPKLTPGTSYFPGVISSSEFMVFVVGLFVSLIFVFSYFLLKEGESKKEFKFINVYFSYLPTVILLLTMAVFSYVSIHFPNSWNYYLIKSL